MKNVNKKLIWMILIFGLVLAMFLWLVSRTTYDNFPMNMDTSEYNKQKTLDNLIINDENASFLINNTTLNKDKSITVLTIGVRNKKTEWLNYKIKFNPIAGPNGKPFSIETWAWSSFDEKRIGELLPLEADVRSIMLKVPASISSGNYILKFQVLDNDLQPPDNIYYEQNFNITVK